MTRLGNILKVNKMVVWKDVKKLMILDLIIEAGLVVMAIVFFRFEEYLTQGENLALGSLLVVTAMFRVYMFLLKIATVTEI